jgi:hypothetical protein
LQDEPFHHGRQISESESEAQAATGESQKRDSEETATGFSRQGGAEKEVDDAARQQPWFVRRQNRSSSQPEKVNCSSVAARRSSPEFWNPDTSARQTSQHLTLMIKPYRF